MINKVKSHIKNVENFDTNSQIDLENFRIKYLGKKGLVTDLFKLLKNIDQKDKKSYGKALNDLKKEVNIKIKLISKKLNSQQKISNKDFDLSRPGFPFKTGSSHPISIVKNKIIDIFSKIGYGISEGPEIEDDWHNFTALNLPKYHPARDMQDTFFVKSNPEFLLRTHTSSVQVRYMEEKTPPIRIISPGRVYRNEAISSRSHCIFHQIEGLYINKNVSFSELKQTIIYFTKSLFGKSKIRLRPSYFPFTEPSAEVDIFWGLKSEVDHKITKGTGWLEIMGCGMVDPNVLDNCKINSDEYSGFAFGMGIERITMLLYQIEDIRLFYENDVRFISQFKKSNFLC